MYARLEQLTMEYEGKRVLDIPEAVIPDGKRTAVLGANGAGKSTLLSIAAGLLRPTSGRVYYGNINKKKEGKQGEITSPPAREMTMVFQSPCLLSDTVEKNIAYPLKLRKWSREKTEERVEELCRELGLSELRRQKSWKLSGGEIQKTALARALSFHPRLLLLDEPTANIDPASTAEIERMLRKINEEEGTTVALVTHNLAQARRVCDHLIFLHGGRVVEAGGCEQIIENPRKEWTRRFLAGELLI